ncbi:hypothetical protein ABZ863_26950 [Saccharomonospora sp. NPDC046836]|uniref:hypothetical protein n=1 Tax=Saccharomonospora sp. NPDC046836 TaxID=3156921 RepID=UPI0033D33AB1
MQGNVALPRSVHEVVEELFMVGGVVPADGRQCWAPVAPGRWLPMQTHVLRRDGASVVIDTSVTALRDSLAEGLDHVLGASSLIDVVMTRYNFDTLVNFPWLSRRFTLNQLFTSLLSNFVLGSDTVMSFMDAFEDAHVDAHVRSISDFEPMAMAQNQDFEAGGRRMRCVGAPLRLLQTNWVYDFDTRSLFCSDSWGCVSLSDPDETPIVRPGQSDRLDRATVEAGLRNRFDWLLGADTDPIRRQLDELFDAYPIERLCPSHGAVIDGVENVETVRRHTDDVLREFSRTPVPLLVVGTPAYPTRVVDREGLKESA